jgi:hypothetical protein
MTGMGADLAMGYWQTEHPILLESLAAQVPGTTPEFVAEMLVDVEKSLTNPSDGAVVFTYLDMIAAPDNHHGKHGVPT